MELKCECGSTCCCAVRPGPAAYLVVREGILITVCTRCVGATDHIVSILVDEVTPSFEDYDDLGSRVLKRRMRHRPRVLS